LQLGDTRSSYGWVSIAAHWISAIVVCALWLIGHSIRSDASGDAAHLHTSIAVTAYVFLWWRVIRRFTQGHPHPLPRQRGWAFTLGKYTHFTLLAAIAVMLLSGPLMVWSRGEAIHIFQWQIASPFASHAQVATELYRVHATAAAIIGFGILLHIAGVYKHAAFNRDGTFTRMLVPTRAEGRKPDTAAAAPFVLISRKS
jgi:cytochrome b561